MRSIYGIRYIVWWLCVMRHGRGRMQKMEDGRGPMRCDGEGLALRLCGMRITIEHRPMAHVRCTHNY
jgi:hypothetical protein